MPADREYNREEIDEGAMRRDAAKVAAALRERGDSPRGPRAPKTTTEVVSEGFLGIGRKTAERHDDGGGPRFWIVDARRESGMFAVYKPGSRVSNYGWMGGDLAVLLEDGQLRHGYWREDPLGSYWTVSDLAKQAMDKAGLTMFDFRGGQWRNVRPLEGEQHREEFDRQYSIDVDVPGGALSSALERLLDGKGITLHGHPTGMLRAPSGP
jgi:hypothetical protein